MAKKKIERRYDAEWREQVHAEAQAVLAKVRARDAAWRKARDETRAEQQKRNQRVST